MLISVVNHSKHLPDADLQAAVRAINRQLEEDFFPHWQFGARLRMDGAGRAPTQRERKVDLPRLPGRRGDAVIYILDKATMSGTEGYHEGNNADVPYGFVFLDACSTNPGDGWTVALSHEALELVGDPLNNLLVQGPHPVDPHRTAIHQFEMCDAVCSEYYVIEGIEVQNFLLPGWFVHKDVQGARNDFLGRTEPGTSLAPFSPAPGGYLMFLELEANGRHRWVSHFDKSDHKAAAKVRAKLELQLSRPARRQAA